MDKVLFIIRGVAGAGKSTLADIIADEVWEADMYFEKFCGGEFKPERLPRAHAWCLSMVDEAMSEGVGKIAVSNTSTRRWEMEEYYRIAKNHGYNVHQIIVENTHGNKSIHQVPEETIQKMKDRFEVCL